MKKEESVIKLTIIYVSIGLAIFAFFCLIVTFFEIFNISAIDVFILVVTLFSITIFAISIEMNRKSKTKSYNRNTENLISPVLAETIIDGKTDLKNLIMTTIIQLSLKGNIEIIDNKTIKLIDRFNNLEEYELELLNLIFLPGKRIIEFSDINSIFSKSKDGAYIFAENLSRAKIKILEHLCKIKIMSEKYIKFITYMKTLSVLIMVNIPILTIFFLGALSFSINVDFAEILEIFIFFNLFIGFFSFFIFAGQSSFKQETINIKKSAEKSKNRGYPTILYFLFIMFPIIISLFNLYIESQEYFRKVLVIIILNFLIIFVNKTNALTDFGRKERLKLLELKNYINEYSLIKDRDLKSVVVWDEYLAYATAFGIPSKITSQIYESWYNMNITIQFIGSLF